MNTIKPKKESRPEIDSSWVGDFESGTALSAAVALIRVLQSSNVNFKIPDPQNFHGKRPSDLLINVGGREVVVSVLGYRG